MTPPRLPGFPITVSFRMHWGEMDAMGHANNARFFTWFESARLAYFERLTMSFEASRRIGPILAHIECDYLQPVVYPASLLCGARVSSVGRTSLTMEHALAREEAPGDLLARGKAIGVLISYSTGERIPFPDSLRVQIENLEKAAQSSD